MNDNQYITKTDLKEFGKELVDSLEQRLDQKLEVKLSSMEERLRKENALYFGLIKDDFDHRFSTIQEALVDIPEITRVLRVKFEDNEDEHKEFRMRIGVLERR